MTLTFDLWGWYVTGSLARMSGSYIPGFIVLGCRQVPQNSIVAGPTFLGAGTAFSYLSPLGQGAETVPRIVARCLVRIGATDEPKRSRDLGRPEARAQLVLVWVKWILTAFFFIRNQGFFWPFLKISHFTLILFFPLWPRPSTFAADTWRALWHACQDVTSRVSSS